MAMLTESGLRRLIKEELKKVLMEDAKQQISDLLNSLGQDLANIQAALQPLDNDFKKKTSATLDKAEAKVDAILAKGGYGQKFQSITPQTTRFQGSKV